VALRLLAAADVEAIGLVLAEPDALAPTSNMYVTGMPEIGGWCPRSSMV